MSLKQRAFVTEAARALDKAKMMRFDEKSGNFYCTELGRIASHFYIQFSSVETYNEMLRRHMSDSEVGFDQLHSIGYHGCAFLTFSSKCLITILLVTMMSAQSCRIEGQRLITNYLVI